jgi:hypothetical protein
MIRVVKYFEKRHVVSALTLEAARGVRLQPNKRHVVSPLEEVIQEELQKKSTAQKLRGHSPEQVRQIKAKNLRLTKEAEGYKEAQVGRNWISDSLDLDREIRRIAREKVLA